MKQGSWFQAVLIVGLTALSTVARAEWRSEGPFVGNVTDVAVDGAKPDTIYAATSGGGVWRSDDGGQNWVLPGSEMTSRNVEWVQVDPGNSATLWAGLAAHGEPGLWRSLDRGKTWAVVHFGGASYAVGQRIAFAASDPKIIFVPSTNLHYRSADGGKTWVSFRVPGQDAYAFAVDPRNPKVVYAGGDGTDHKFSRSQDGGATWRPAGQGLTRSIKRLHVSAANPQTLYATSSSNQVFKSSDSGATWTELERGGTSELYDLKLNPHDPQGLLAATADGLRQSTDGGDSWSTVGAGLGAYLGQVIAFDPKRKDTIYAGVGGTGLFKSIDGGETFSPFGTGLAAGWAEKLYAPANGAGPIFAQLSVGFFRLDGPGAWTEIQTPFAPGEPAKIDGIVFDRVVPKRVYAHDGSRWWRSEDAGRAWTGIEVPAASLKNMMKGKVATPGFKSLVQDPVDAKTFYCGAWNSHEPGTVVFKSIDGGKKWAPAAIGLASEAVTLLRSAAAGTVFAVGGKDGVYRTSDGGKSWRLVRPGEIKELAVDATTPERVFVATSKGLFRSTDSGETWARTTQGLEGDEVEAVAVAPKDGQAFAGTFHGVFRSTDGGATWAPLPGLANTDVRALAIAGGSPARLYAGLAGGSVFSTEIP